MTTEKEFFEDIDQKTDPILSEIIDLNIRIEALILILKTKSIMNEDEYQLALKHVANDKPLSADEDFLEETVNRFHDKL
jgi:hypothetical protein